MNEAPSAQKRRAADIDEDHSYVNKKEVNSKKICDHPKHPILKSPADNIDQTPACKPKNQVILMRTKDGKAAFNHPQILTMAFDGSPFKKALIGNSCHILGRGSALRFEIRNLEQIKTPLKEITTFGPWEVCCWTPAGDRTGLTYGLISPINQDYTLQELQEEISTLPLNTEEYHLNEAIWHRPKTSIASGGTSNTVRLCFQGPLPEKVCLGHLVYKVSFKYQILPNNMDNAKDKVVLEVKHITPSEETLSYVQAPMICQEEGCNRTFLNLPVLKLHQAQCHEHRKIQRNPDKSESIEEWFHCPVNNCIYNQSFHPNGKHFAKAKYVKQHYLKVHAAHKFHCQLCGKSFSTQSFLTSHLMYCDMEIKCSCGQNFSSIESLQTHVRRFQHESEALSAYLCRTKKKKNEKSNIEKSKACIPSWVKDSSDLPGEALPLITNSPILPKIQPSHIVAAIALSELAFAGLKRLPAVDVGVQTDFVPNKRLSRKNTSSPIRNRDTEHKKRKQTTEMETQTCLTNLKSKSRKKCATKKMAKCTMATGTKKASHIDSLINSIQTETDGIKEEDFLYHNVNSSDVNSVSTNLIAFSNQYEKNYTYPPENHFSSSGTQTSPRTSIGIFTSNNVDCLPYDLFRERLREVDKDMTFHDGNTNVYDMYNQQQSFDSVDPNREEAVPDVIEINVEDSLPCTSDDLVSNISSTKKQMSDQPSCSNFNTSQIMIDEEGNLVSMSPSGVISSVSSTSKRPPSLAHIRSSSIETQTDHDVFLSTHAEALDDADDIILTSTQTQTERDSPSLWCTIETQTCEDFSDIEQFLRSTIHTQTHDEATSTELFPELNNFTTDTQTQTGLEDSPVLITTHTQTFIFGLGSNSKSMEEKWQ